jgi:hypothetical protein
MIVTASSEAVHPGVTLALKEMFSYSGKKET